jgi:phage N-6-adenine-methyltransferase
MENVHFSHETNEWATPQDFFDKVSKEFGGFDLDTCATAENAKCAKFFDIAASGLDQHWEAKNWCNPPYWSRRPDGNSCVAT